MHFSPQFRSALTAILASVVVIATATAQSDVTRRQIDALLGMHDTFVTREQWKPVGPGAEQILETIAADSSAQPSRRARALEGITQLNPAGAAVILHSFAYGQNKPAVVRMAAIHGLGRILPADKLLPELRPLLNYEFNVSV